MKTFFIPIFYSLLLFTFPTISSAQWQPMQGPYGGAATHLSQNDDYAFAYSTVIYRSADAGNSWSPLAILGNSVYSCNRLSVNGKQLLADITTNAPMLAKSNDNGATWKKITLPDYKGSIQMSLLNNHAIYLLSYNKDTGNQLWQTSDEGNTWKTVVLPTIATAFYTFNCFDQRLYLSAGNKLYRADAQGAQWETLDIPLSKCSLFVQDSVMLIQKGGAIETGYCSKDSGKTWQYNRGWNDAEANYTYLNNRFFKMDNKQVFVSSDLGKTWKATHAPSDYPDNQFIIAHKGILLVSDLVRGINRSTDEGKIFTKSNFGYWEARVTNLAIHDNKLYASCGKNGIYAYATNTETWDTSNVFPITSDITTFFTDANSLYIVGPDGYYNILYRSNNNGKTWEILPLYQSSNTSKYYSVRQLASSGNTLVGIDRSNTEIGRLIKSMDNGKTWISDTTNCSTCSISCIASQKGQFFATTANGILRSSDGTKTWQTLSSSLSLNPKNKDRNYLYASNNTLFYVVQGDVTNPISVFFSEDAGDTWTDISATFPSVSLGFLVPGYSFPNLYFQYKPFHNMLSLGNVWAATMPGDAKTNTPSGIYISTDKGKTWAIGNGNSGGFYPNYIEADETYLYAATSGRGVWKRPLSTLIATADAPPMQSVPLFTLPILPNPNNGFFQIDLSASDETAATTLSIYQPDGKIVQQQTVQLGQKNTIDASRLTAGIYWLSVVTKKGIWRGKVVKE